VCSADAYLLCSVDCECVLSVDLGVVDVDRVLSVDLGVVDVDRVSSVDIGVVCSIVGGVNSVNSLRPGGSFSSDILPS